MTPIQLEEGIRTLLTALDLLGTFVFALSGAASGVRARLDFFGVLVLSFAAANSGGIMRDVLVGAVPPAALRGWNYFGITAAAGVVTFFFHPRFDRLRPLILVLDAAGLSIFAVSGCQKALSYGIDPIVAALFGVLTGIGGGIVRDILINEVPLVLRAELYAVAALLGSAVVAFGHLLGLSPLWSAVAGASLCFTLRVLAIKLGWRLPVASSSN